MKIHTSTENSDIPQSVVAIGAFDGLHLGHQNLIERVKEKARELGAESVVITFNPHPYLYFHPEDKQFKLLSTAFEKTNRFYQMGIDHLILLTFNEALSRQDGESFIKNHLVENLRMVHLVAGPEFSLGNDRLSKPEQLQDVGARTGFTFEIVPSFRLGKQAVSSTLIRYKLQVGDVEAANSMLGYEYKLWGRVTTGNQIGKAIGFPTANLELDLSHKAIPCNGVYVVAVSWEGRRFQGMCNIGRRPTISRSNFSIEIHIIDFDRDIYDEYIAVCFLKRIRDEKKFENLRKLSEQLEKDKATTLQYFKKSENRL